MEPIQEYTKKEIRSNKKTWQEISLEELIDVIHGYAFKGQFFTDKPTKYVLLTPGNFSIGGGFKNEKITFYDGPLDENFVLLPGDIIITMTDLSKMGDTLGYPAIVPSSSDFKYLHNQRLGKVSIKNSEKLFKLFLYYLLCSSKYRQEILSNAAGTTVRHTSPSRIRSFKFNLPTFPEQQKIASILSNVDNLIQETDQVIFHYQRLKKGLMQKLLTRGIQHTKLKKTKWGEIPENWIIMRIGDMLKEGMILELQDGNHGELYPRKKDFSTEGRIFLNANSITDDGFLNIQNSLRLPEAYCKKLRIGFTKGGDVLFTHNATVGRVAILPESFEDAIVGTSITYYRLNNKSIDKKYFSYSLQSTHFKSQLNQVMFQSTRMQVPITTQSKLSIVLPPLQEQQKIGLILSNIDNLIQNLRDKKKSEKILKNSIMRQLLTGKVSVKV